MTTPAAPTLETAGWGRRIAALVVDFLASMAVARFLISTGIVPELPYALVPTGLFILESAFLTALVGGSFGKLALRLRVVRQNGSPQPIGLLPAVLRTVLVALLVPPLLTMDGRGLHDVAAGTRTVKL